MESIARQRCKELFDQARKLDANQRDAYLAGVCGSDVQLRAEVVQLLADLDAAVDLFAEPTRDGSPRSCMPPAAIIGPYKLLERIGEGGFGTVYMAEQREPVQRRVALKVVKPGMDSKQVIARFEAERQALAMMDHPNIARVLDAGEHRLETGATIPYFVMELVRGVPITKFCDENNLTIRQRLELAIDVCHAVQHAHMKGVIHRDLKPSNVLVTMHDDKAVPKVIDFGIAKATQGRLTEKTLYTEFRQLIGTPAYMSPEQAQMSGIDIDTRSDIYSLGVMLYELLTGTTPFNAKTLLDSGYDEMRRIIREVEPPRPSTRVSAPQSEPDARARESSSSGAQPLAGASGSDSSAAVIAAARHTDPASLRRLLHGEPDWIVMKCLEKDRTRRYETANSLAADIAHHLAGEPVVAAPPSRMYRLRKVLRRHRASVTFATTIALLLVGATAVSLILWQQSQANAIRAQDQADRASRQAEETELAATLLADIIGKTEPDEKPIPNDLMQQRLDRFAARFEPKLAGYPEVEARVRLALGNAYRAILDGKHAELHLGRALAIYRDLYGPEHPKVATATHDWAELLVQREDLAAAEATHREALAMRMRLFKGEHPDVADSLASLGDCLERRGQREEALSQHEAALAMQQRLHPGDHPAVAGSLNNLGHFLQMTMNRPGDALEKFEAALAMRQRLYPDGHLDVANSLSNVAFSLAALGRAEEALPKYQAALEMQQRIYRGDHADIALVLTNLGSCICLSLKRPADALPSYEAALEMRQRLFAGDDDRVIDSLLNVAQTLFMVGRADEALAKYQSALEMQQRLYKGDHIGVRNTLHEQGNALVQLGRWDEAVEKLEASWAMHQRLGAADDEHVSISVHNLGYGLQMLGRPEEALPRFEAAAAMRQRLHPEGHPEVVRALGRVAHCFETLGRLDEATERYEAALKMARRLEAKPRILTERCLEELGRCLLNRRMCVEAEPYLRECVALREKSRKPGGIEWWFVAADRSLLGAALVGQAVALVESDQRQALAKLAEAEPLLLSGYEGLRDDPHVYAAARKGYVEQALQRIIKLYETWDQLAPDAGYAEKAAEWRARLDAYDETPTSGPAP